MAEEKFPRVLRACVDIRSYYLFSLADLLTSLHECDEPILSRRHAVTTRATLNLIRLSTMSRSETPWRVGCVQWRVRRLSTDRPVIFLVPSSLQLLASTRIQLFW
jgi:hypothetical protein